MLVRALTVGLGVGMLGLLTACAPAGDEVVPGEAPSATSPAAAPGDTSDSGRASPEAGETPVAGDPLDPEASGIPAGTGAVMVHKGGEDEVSVLIDGEPEDLKRVRIVVGTDHVGWRDSPARLGPVVGIAGAVEPLDVTLAYPPGVTGALDADGLLVVAETSVEDVVFLDPAWDDARGAFVVDVTVRPNEYPQFVLLDRAAHAALFE